MAGLLIRPGAGLSCPTLPNLDMFNRIAFFALMAGTITAGFALSSETTYMHRECVANGSSYAECSVKLYGR